MTEPKGGLAMALVDAISQALALWDGLSRWRMALDRPGAEFQINEVEAQKRSSGQ